MSTSRRRVDVFEHHKATNVHNKQHTEQLQSLNNAHTQDGVGGGSKLGVMTDSIASSNNTISSQSVLTASRLNNIQNAITQDGVGGGNKLGVMTDAINTNIISSLSKLDTIATNTANIHIDVESVNLNVDTLEAKTEAISNAQTQDGVGGGNKPGVMLDAINTNTITGNSKLDTIITNTASSSSTGLATDTNLTALKNSLTGDGAGGDNKPGVMLKAINDNIINTNTVALSGVDGTLQGIDTLLGDTQTIHTATNTKLDTLITSNAAIKTAVEIIDNVVSGSEAQVDVVTLPALATGSNTIGTVNLSATDNAVLDAIATDGDNIQTKLDTLITSNAAIKTAVEILDNVVSGSEAQVDIVSSALPSGAATQATLADAETHLGNIETSVQLIDDVVKAEDTAHSGADKGIMGLSVRKDTATALAGSDADYQPMITGSAGHLHVSDSLFNRVTDVVFMTTETISANSRSSTTLDTLGYSNVVIYGEVTGGTSTINANGNLKIQGSNASSGTYYGIGFLNVSAYEGSRVLLVDGDTSNGNTSNGNYPRYLKIYNNTSGTAILTLRATMSGFKTYI